MRHFLLIIFLAAITLSVTAHAPLDSIGMTKQEGKFFIKYLVEPGQTIYRISTKFGVPISELLEVNPELENGLKTGQVILIPYTPERKPAPEVDDSQYHTVEKGETYFSISKKYGIPLGDLLKANNVELKAGQKIVVKKGGTPSFQPEEEMGGDFNATPTKTEKVALAPVAESKPKVEATKPAPAVESKPTPVVEPESAKTANPAAPNETLYTPDYNNGVKRVLVVPFDPYLYFSDADDEIAAVSKMNRTKVRQAFRKRLNAYLEPKGYQTIHLLGGTSKDSTTDLNKIYSSITYTYDDVMMKAVRPEEKPDAQQTKGNVKKQTKNFDLSPQAATLQSRSMLAKDEGKYFSVKIKDANFFPFFNHKYKPDYYIFISQFEVKTNYENCLDRARQNYQRDFVTHFSIFDKSGAQISGGRLKSNYESGTNNLEKILSDNIPTLANKIMAELP
jgi:LysM repeat protein